MQKISSYLYPNRINVVADVALFPVRWNIVYQNRIKIYQGVDNVLTIDVKNSDQKRIDISTMDLRMIVTDVNGLLVTDAEIVPSETTTGLAIVTIPEADLVNVTPQFLKFSIYRVNLDNTKTVLYADTLFGAIGNMELVGTVMDVPAAGRVISRFIPVTDPTVLGLPPYEVRYYSDAEEVLQPNFIKDPTLEKIDLDFKLLALEGTIAVQFTKDPVISSATDWTTVDSFSVESTTTSVSKTYNTENGYSREIRWARVYYIRLNNNTGSIDKVTITV